MSRFFPVKSKRGGQKKKSSNAGRPPAPAPVVVAATRLSPPSAAANPVPVAAQLATVAAKAKAGSSFDKSDFAAMAAVAKALEPPKTRINWSKGEPLELLRKAIEGWSAAKATGISIAGYARQCKIPKQTLAPYLSGKKELGKGQGRPGILNKEEEGLMVDTIRRYDRSRKGLAPKEVANLGHEICPALSDEQASSWYPALPSATWR